MGVIALVTGGLAGWARPAAAVPSGNGTCRTLVLTTALYIDSADVMAGIAVDLHDDAEARRRFPGIAANPDENRWIARPRESDQGH